MNKSACIWHKHYEMAISIIVNYMRVFFSHGYLEKLLGHQFLGILPWSIFTWLSNFTSIVNLTGTDGHTTANLGKNAWQPSWSTLTQETENGIKSAFIFVVISYLNVKWQLSTETHSLLLHLIDMLKWQLAKGIFMNALIHHSCLFSQENEKLTLLCIENASQNILKNSHK